MKKDAFHWVRSKNTLVKAERVTVSQGRNKNTLVTAEKVASHWVRSIGALVTAENKYTQLNFPL